MSMTIGQANAVQTVLDWLDALCLWEGDTDLDDAFRDAITTLAAGSYKALKAGRDATAAEAILVRLLGDGTEENPGREAYGRRTLLSDLGGAS